MLQVLEIKFYLLLYTEYGRDLEKDIKSEEDGPLGRIFRSLASGDRPSGNAVDQGLAHTEAKQLYDVSFKKIILCSLLLFKHFLKRLAKVNFSGLMR